MSHHPRDMARLEQASSPTLVGRIEVVRDSFGLELELEIGAGEVLAVLGPNGSGKTTLLHALAGLLPLENGRLELGGSLLEDAATGHRLPPQRRRIGVVFQHHRLFPGMNVADNVMFGPKAMGWTKAEARGSRDEVMRALSLTELAERLAGDLSTGQSQRVAIARALAAQPHLFLLDEPMAALDLDARATVIELLRKRLREPARPDSCALLVTHRPDAARALADRWLVLEAGRAVQCGVPEALASAPATPFVRSLFES